MVGVGLGVCAIFVCLECVYVSPDVFVTLGLGISVFVSFLVFMDQSVQVVDRSKLRTDGTPVCL